MCVCGFFSHFFFFFFSSIERKRNESAIVITLLPTVKKEEEKEKKAIYGSDFAWPRKKNLFIKRESFFSLSYCMSSAKTVFSPLFFSSSSLSSRALLWLPNVCRIPFGRFECQQANVEKKTFFFLSNQRHTYKICHKKCVCIRLELLTVLLVFYGVCNQSQYLA